MVVFIDLDEDDVPDDPYENDLRHLGALAHEKDLSWRNHDVEQRQADLLAKDHSTATKLQRPNPNLNATSAAFGCYPYAIVLG